MIIFYIIGVSGVILCWSPHFVYISHELTYNPTSSPIYESMKSSEFINFLMISLGLCIPMFLEYIFDLITFGFSKDTHLGYLSRLLLLNSLLLPDIFLLLYIIPYERAELWGTVTAIRTMLCVCVSFGHIWQNGVNCKTELILSVCGFILRSYISVIDSEYVEFFQISILVIAAILILKLNIRWFRSLKDIKLEDLSAKQLSSTIHMVSLVVISIALIIVRTYYGPMNSQSTVQNLVAYKVSQAMFVMFVFLAHSRILQKEMIQTQKKLETKRLFVRLVSHEIRTPLNIVVTGLKCLEKEIANKTNHNNSIRYNKKLLVMIKEIQSSCDISIEILNDLLAYEKLEAGIMTLEKEDIPIWLFLKETLQPFGMQARQTNVQLKFTADIITVNLLQSCVLRADRNKLSQVLRNLMSNAIKFTPVGGSVTVSLSVINVGRSHFQMLTIGGGASIGIDTHRIRIDVKDTGYGISKENIPKLFNDIVQFDAEKSQKGGGSGIGLWISKSLMTLHEGSISAVSEGIGHGCTFTIELPVFLSTDDMVLDHTALSDERLSTEMKIWDEDDLSVNMIPSSPSSPPIERQHSGDSGTYLINSMRGRDSGNNNNNNSGIELVPAEISSRVAANNNNRSLPVLLMVDDSIMSRKMVNRLIYDRFSYIYEADDGNIAVDIVRTTLAESKNIDIILMDYQMPNMDGPTATKFIREMGYKGTIIGLTGNALPNDISYFMSQGANTVLTKPLNLDLFNVIVSDE